MKILAIIPARGGSKGVPGKNIKQLGDKPLIAYSIESAKNASMISKVIISTDDQNIAEVALQYGAVVPFMRPAELATDTARSIDVVIHALIFMQDQGESFDAVCLLQPTTPFRTQGFIDVCIEQFIQRNADSLISVSEVPAEYNPHWTFEVNHNGFLHIATGEQEIIPQRQLLPKAYFRDGSVYLTKTEVLMNGSLYGQKISYKISSGEVNINIDTMNDWLAAEAYLQKIK